NRCRRSTRAPLWRGSGSARERGRTKAGTAARLQRAVPWPIASPQFATRATEALACIAASLRFFRVHFLDRGDVAQVELAIIIVGRIAIVHHRFGIVGGEHCYVPGCSSAVLLGALSRRVRTVLFMREADRVAELVHRDGPDAQLALSLAGLA